MKKDKIATETEMDLTMSECRGIQNSMEQQSNVLKKLFKALEEAKKNPGLMDGVSEDDVKFAEKYCNDMVYACATLTTIAKNAEEILKPIEEAKRKEEEEKRQAEKKAKDEKPKKKRAPRKKKAPAKIAQEEPANDIVEEVPEEDDGDGEA